MLQKAVDSRPSLRTPQSIGREVYIVYRVRPILFPHRQLLETEVYFKTNTFKVVLLLCQAQQFLGDLGRSADMFNSCTSDGKRLCHSQMLASEVSRMEWRIS